MVDLSPLRRRRPRTRQVELDGSGGRLERRAQAHRVDPAAYRHSRGNYARCSDLRSPPRRAPTAATQLTLTTGANDQVRQVTYVVRRGDSLSSIARRFRVTVPKLVEWNDVSIQRYLQPGQRLVMFINVLEQSG